MRLDQMPYHSMPTLAVLPFRQFSIGWTWQLRALKLFPDSQLSWKRYSYDNGSGHARAAVFTSYEEATEAADEFNRRTSELVVQAVPDPVLQSSTTLKVEKALTAARRIHAEEELMEREAIKRNAHLPRPNMQELELHNNNPSTRSLNALLTWR
ncbi:hypothetical protein [Pseudomonas kitaguniensis]|uniref:hypothetical protein n=1 Tax=Pseudomonas kitaguniensis TaxID=2607908 RepID=UPI003D023836